MSLIGFLHRGGIEQWSYAIACDVVSQGNDFVRFTMDDVDFKTRTVLGEVWEDGKWLKKRTRFPDAIRNFELKKGFDHILDVVPYSLGPIVRKDDQLELFGKVPEVLKYMPKSLNVDKNCSIIEKVLEWKGALLKPARGRLGQGIIFLKPSGNKFNINDDGKIKTVTKKGLEEYLKPFYEPDARPYVLQQFAAGTGPEDRYFNIRVIVSKSGDADWHTCNFLMSLLAKNGSIIANRDVGAKNIDLDAFLKFKYGKNVKKIYDELFEAAVKITRVLDDSANATAEEIALDMAIDNDGNVWLHEANWRGGMWLFDDDVGLYRHGGLNLNRIALENKSGSSLDISNSMDIAINERTNLQTYFNKQKNSDIDDGVTFGIEISRQTNETVSLSTKAITNAVPVISVSSLNSFRLAQRKVRESLDIVNEQIPNVQLPFIISRAGACVHDPEDEKGYSKWIKDELLSTNIIDRDDYESGFSISPYFLNYTIKENRKDLNVKKLDLFVIEGLEYSLSNKKEWKNKWKAASLEMYEQIKNGRIDNWGFALDIKSINKKSSTNPFTLFKMVEELGLKVPKVLFIKITNDYHLRYLPNLIAKLDDLDMRLVFLLPEKKLVKKEWSGSHETVDKELLKKVKKHMRKGDILLSPTQRVDDIDKVLESINEEKKKDIKTTNPWFYNFEENKSNFLGRVSMSKNEIDKKVDKKRFKKSMEALSVFASFDHRQLFRFFIDGRFHKKYEGWVGYEKNEPGSVPGNLRAYCHIFDNFDISGGLKPSYIRELHALCMKNVLTKNPKTAPGDMRFLEAGFNILAHYSTIDSIQEIIDRHKGEGVPLFHTRGFEKLADEFTAKEVFDALQEKKRLKFRPWYPKLSIKEKEALGNPDNLETFYDVKHKVQKMFALRIDKIVNEYNVEIKETSNDEEKLIAISRVVRNLEMLHPFPDGNGRTFVSILMNHLLLFHGFLPAILFDPNIDIELSVVEFAQEIKRGIENTKLLLEDPEAILYDYSINDSSKKEQEEFEVLAKDLILKISPYLDIAFDIDDKETDSLRTKYIYLTPSRLANISKGNWINISKDNLEKLRFESIQVDEVKSSNQLFFFRNIEQMLENGIDEVLKYIEKLAKNGVISIVTDNLEVARKSSLPALYVEDVDDSLASTARTTRREVKCKALAVVGTSHKKEIKNKLVDVLSKQSSVNMYDGLDNKTPHIMASLSNLRLTDNFEVTEIDITTRPNPIRYRSRRVEPNITLLTDLELDSLSSENLEKSIDAYSAMVEGFVNGGLYILNSNSSHTETVIDKALERKEVSIQTYGLNEEDEGKLINSTFDEKKKVWNIQAEILGKKINYELKSEDKELPLLSVGVLLTVENLGHDIFEASKAFA